mmetsp:Transcript_44927/g.73204  ORF Transcript_44927/g.73204 Transcript_44927/m.73204 type:complete len:317 (+) Transcript_44927:1217-2167(+)
MNISLLSHGLELAPSLECTSDVKVIHLGKGIFASHLLCLPNDCTQLEFGSREADIDGRELCCIFCGQDLDKDVDLTRTVTSFRINERTTLYRRAHGGWSLPIPLKHLLLPLFAEPSTLEIETRLTNQIILVHHVLVPYRDLDSRDTGQNSLRLESLKESRLQSSLLDVVLSLIDRTAELKGNIAIALAIGVLRNDVDASQYIDSHNNTFSFVLLKLRQWLMIWLNNNLCLEFSSINQRRIVASKKAAENIRSPLCQYVFLKVRVCEVLLQLVSYKPSVAQERKIERVPRVERLSNRLHRLRSLLKARHHSSYARYG